MEAEPHHPRFPEARTWQLSRRPPSSMTSTEVKPARRWHFGLDGARFEIDLNRKKAAALRKSLAGFVAASRVVKPESTMRRQSRKAANGQASGPLPAQIRSWAVGQGIEVPARGRIPETVRAQYLSTHPGVAVFKNSRRRTSNDNCWTAVRQVHPPVQARQACIVPPTIDCDYDASASAHVHPE